MATEVVAKYAGDHVGVGSRLPGESGTASSLGSFFTEAYTSRFSQLEKPKYSACRPKNVSSQNATSTPTATLIRSSGISLAGENQKRFQLGRSQDCSALFDIAH